MTAERIDLIARAVLIRTSRSPDVRILAHLKAAGFGSYKRSPATVAVYHAIVSRWTELRRESGIGRKYRADSLPIRRARVDV